MPRVAAKTPTRAKKPKVKRTPKPAPDRPSLPHDAVLLALDASSSAIGWAVYAAGHVQAAGVVRAPSSWSPEARMIRNTEDILAVVAARRPTVVAMEFQSHKSFAKHVQGLSTLGHAQGFLWATIRERHPGLPVERISERDWTRGTKWNGLNHRNVAKEVRAAVVMRMVPEYRAVVAAKGRKIDAGLDVADALGIGLWRLGKIG